MFIDRWAGQFACALRRCRTCGAALSFAILLSIPTPVVYAHEGHDHGGEKPAIAVAASPRAAAQSEIFEVVAVLNGDRLLITLDHIAENTPVAGATLTVSIGSRGISANSNAAGEFEVTAAELRGAGTFDLVFDIKDGANSDLLIASLEVPPADKGRAAFSDAPRRLPDASVFLPKASQRLLDVRTVMSREAAEKPRTTLVGRVIANPDRSGVVQSSIGGRFSPPAGGLPRLGQAIKAGDVLGYVAPVFAPIDVSDRAQTAGNLDQQIELVTAKLNRLRPLISSGAATKSSVADAEIELQGLERRRAALQLAQAKPEPLVAPINGVLASMKVTSGQVVSSQDQLFHLVDTTNLWVEALLFDPTGPSAFSTATATVQNGASFELSFVGEGRILQQQSTVLNFAIQNPPPLLRVGTPVSVLVPTGEPITGILLPKSAVLRASNGETIVWLHNEPERFVSRPVRATPFDGDRVLIAAGLKPGERVVVRGAELINQVR